MQAWFTLIEGLDLLQADNVRIQLLDDLGNSFRVLFSVRAYASVNVISRGGETEFSRLSQASHSYRWC